MGLFKKVKQVTEKTVRKGVDVGKNVGEKSVEVGKEVGEKGLELGKKGVGKIKKFVTNEEDPLQILKIRYAQGEITKKQYEEMKKTLEMDPDC